MLAISSLFLALILAQAAPEQTGRISGRVTVEGANTPLAGVRIMLLPTARPTGPMGMPPQALTDQDGRYVFDRIAAGAYRVTADKSGYAPIGDLSRAPMLQVTGGQPITFDLQLQKGAVIAGRIVDARGEPVTDARIMVLRRMTPPSGAPLFRGMTRLIPAGGQSQQTNDLGDYRVAGLAPGEYFVAAMPRPMVLFGTAASDPARDRRALRTTLPTTYYPGTADQAAAMPIAVAAGAEVGNISFAMQPVPAFRVSGIVVDQEGKAIGGAMVMLLADPRSGAFSGPVGNATARDDGRFEIDGVPAGSYHANASVMMSRGASSGGVVRGSGGAVASGSVTTWSSGGTVNAGAGAPPAEVVVADADITDVRVVTKRPGRP